MGWRKSERGMRCAPNANGALRCRPFETSGDRKLATGSEISWNVDPVSCKATTEGGFDMLEKDEESIDRQRKKLENACKDGTLFSQAQGN